MNDDSPATDLDWLAFQYVTDALSSEACAAFEERMLESQECREAVARAVELMVATKSACRLPDAKPAPASISSTAGKGATRPSRRMRDRRWLGGLAVAASAALVIGWQAAIWLRDHKLVSFPGDSITVQNAPQESGGIFGAGRDGVLGPDLALAWSQTRNAFVGSENEQESPLQEMVADPDAPADAAAEAMEAPSWMLAAVAGMQQGPGSDPSPAEDAGAPERESGRSGTSFEGSEG